MTDTYEDIKQVTDEAIEKGYQNANDDWKNMAMECVRVICVQQPSFTMNDVRWLVEASPIKTQDNRAMGGVMRTAQKLGWVEPTGQTIISKVGHKSLLQIWRSKLFKSKDTLF